MKIYTRTGDDGTTGLWGGLRVPKDALRVESYGTVDECNANIGAARAAGVADSLDALLGQIQDLLFVVGSDLATPGDAPSIPRVEQEAVELLERAIDDLEAELEPLRQFILPGGCPAAAQLHIARTVCRRAERSVVALGRSEQINPIVPTFLNRLSDLLFVAARSANASARIPDVPWSSPRLSRRNPASS